MFLLVGTCVAVGLIMVIMGVSIAKDQVSMSEVVEGNVGNIEKS